jgi:outer membrane protein OmpA-like peptidoglycan-associated protein
MSFFVRALLVVGFLLLASHGVAQPSPFAVHVEAGAARMVGPKKSRQFGWGGLGTIAAEWRFHPRVGLELPLGAAALAPGDLSDLGIANEGPGYALMALPGLRINPFGAPQRAVDWSSIWLAPGAGLVFTGGQLRPGLSLRLGADLFQRGMVRLGPTVAYTQVIEGQASLLPEDARLLSFGFHLRLAPPVKRPPPPVAPPAPVEPEVPRCPPEDMDGFQDDDGCLDPDNDGDGVLDVDDRCPNDAEDKDGFLDSDGCPDPDNDQDGLLDAVDKCPNEPETKNNYADEDGCPDVKKVRVVGGTIELDERVYFRVNMAEIRARSWDLLRNLAGLLNKHPAYVLVKVQGHADDTGAPEYNFRLSIARSQAVRNMLVLFGVDPKRLKVEGYGERRPAEASTTVTARRKNRRVEFIILERRTLP